MSYFDIFIRISNLLSEPRLSEPSWNWLLGKETSILIAVESRLNSSCKSFGVKVEKNARKKRPIYSDRRLSVPRYTCQLAMVIILHIS